MANTICALPGCTARPASPPDGYMDHDKKKQIMRKKDQINHANVQLELLTAFFTMLAKFGVPRPVTGSHPLVAFQLA